MTSSDPVMIAVLGGTGAGKTTFVSEATGNTNLEIGHGVESCTQDIQLAPMTLDGKHIVLIDTPGFDDSYRSDTDILKLVAEQFSTLTQAGKYLNGIILLERINNPRVQGNEVKRTRLFKEILGENAYKNVILASTFWGEVNTNTGISREQERVKNPKFWGAMVSGGARVARHDAEKQSAHNIIRMLLNKPKVVLQMQQQLSANGSRVGMTSAGRALDEDLEAKYGKMFKEMTEANAKATASMMEEIRELRREMAAVQAQRDALEAARATVPQSKVRKTNDIFDDIADWFAEDGARYGRAIVKHCTPM